MRPARLSVLLVVLAAPPAAAAEPAAPLRRIAFGSGASQEKPQPVWDAVAAARPDLFLFLGDAIYGDTDNVEVLRAKYAQLAAVPGYQRLLGTCPVLATWNDHDYGLHDGGADFPAKDATKRVFLDFFNEPAESLRRKRPGLYGAWTFGPPGQRVQVILLDTRYFRSPLKTAGPAGYAPNTDPGATILGDAQWQWLEVQLRAPAELRLLVSSVQVVAEDHPYEKWMNFPRERQRLYDLIRDTKAGGVVILSGDRQLAELSQMDAGVGYPLYDLTSGGLNMAARRWRPVEVNRHRVAAMPFGDNFGVVAIDWERTPPRVSLQVHDAEGDVTVQQKLDLTALQPGVLKPAAAGEAVASNRPAAPGAASAGAVTPAEAAKKVNEKVTVEMKVQTTGRTRDGSRVFLNSAADFRAKDNFAAVLDMRKVAEGLKAAGVADPQAFYRGKTVRVTGTVALYRDNPEIIVEDPGFFARARLRARLARNGVMK
jgi:alkaline phosphatase D